MSNTLIIYSTTDGQTVAICNTLVKNHNTDQIKICSIEDAYEENLNKYDKIIIGASIRYGKHNPMVIEFVKKNLERFNKIKTAFFSVNVVARKNNKNTPETNPYVKKFLNKTKWKPTKLSNIFFYKCRCRNSNCYKKKYQSCCKAKSILICKKY